MEKNWLACKFAIRLESIQLSIAIKRDCDEKFKVYWEKVLAPHGALKSCLHLLPATSLDLQMLWCVECDFLPKSKLTAKFEQYGAIFFAYLLQLA